MRGSRLFQWAALMVCLLVGPPPWGWASQPNGGRRGAPGEDAFGYHQPLPQTKSRIRFALQMMEEVRQKEEALARREASLHSQEERLKVLRQEILQTIEDLEAKKRELEEARRRLRQTQARLDDKRRQLEALRRQMEQELDRRVEERLRKLAKVFDETTPEKAGKILSQLDPSTAAALLERMNSRKAGRIWGYVDPKRAKEISRVLTRRGVSLGSGP